MKLPNLTPKQQALIRLIYRYRFLERKQIQTFLGHKDKRRISAWLKELREQQFIDWFYESDNPDERSKPAIYFMGLNGIRLLRQLDEYPEEELRKRHKDSLRRPDFITRCILLADCSLHLEARSKSNDDVTYTYALEADYTDPDDDHHFLSQSEYIHPNLCFVKEADGEETTYLVEIFDITTPRYMVKKKLKSYVEFFDDGEWGKQKGNEELPIILIACPSVAELAYAKRYTRKLLEEHDLHDREDVRIRFATVEQVKKQGMTALIWEGA
jgi:hypothetical protein